MRLTALRPENPVAMMTAYGALRLLPGAELRWPDAHPELRWEGDIITALAARLPERREAPEVSALDDPRDKNIGGIAGYRRLAAEIPHEWLTAYAVERVDGIAHTGLLFLSGGHLFVGAARKVMDGLASTDVAAKIKEALTGPWRYGDDAQAWGWDAAVRLEAPALPMKIEGAHKAGVLGAYWLAWESMPLWQMVNGRTVGHGKRTWTYPTCAEWLSWDGLRAVIMGRAQMPQREKQALGVCEWTAPIIPTSQYGKELGMARRLPLGADAV